MKVNNKLITDIAILAKLDFDDSTIEEMKNDMNKMLGFVDKLNEINTKGVEPLVYLSEEKNVMREDVISESIDQKEALKNSPEKDSDYFKVPKVIKK